MGFLCVIFMNVELVYVDSGGNGSRQPREIMKAAQFEREAFVLGTSLLQGLLM